MPNNTYTTSGAGSWTCPANAAGNKTVVIEVWGSGGGGGGSNNNATAGGAGGAGAGAYAVITVTGLVAGNAYAYYVAPGGGGGTGNANGTAGAASYFNNNSSGNTAQIISGNGGGFGIHGANTGNKAGIGGAANGSGGGITSYKGGNGANNGGTNIGGGGGAAAGNQNAGADATSQSGATGTNGGGSGGSGGARNANGSNGSGPGGGGGGAGRSNTTTGTNRVGGTGANGQVKITWYDAVLPTLTTEAASSVAEESATANGTISDTGGENCTARGFVYDTQSRSLPGNVAPASSGYASYTTESGSYSSGSYTGSLTNLLPNQTYYCRSWAKNSPGYAYGDEETFTTVNWAVRLKASSNIADSAATSTTAQLTAPSGKTTGDFVAGRISDDTNPLPSLDVTTDDYTEFEWCIEATSVAQTNDVLEFRITKAGTVLDTYTVTPSWTIGTGTGDLNISVADCSQAVACVPH